MRKYLLPVLPYCVLIYYFFLTACTSGTPENYFDIAVLNCNTIHGFAGDGIRRELDDPTVRLVAGINQTEPMKRKEIVDQKIRLIEANLQKVRQMKPTDDTKQMLDASRILNEYVLDVYKNEYSKLASLYDTGASAEEIESLEQSIEKKYSFTYVELFENLIATAKPYAEKHHIQVNWDIQTSPL